MRYCKKCVYPDTKPGLALDTEGICQACRNSEKRKHINWKERFKELEKLCDRHRRRDGHYDCIITVSGGKDSHFQVYVMKELMKMNPLLIAVVDPYSKTEAGKHNIKNIQAAFNCNLITYNLSPVATRKFTRIGFEEMGCSTWSIDFAIYSVPLRMAIRLEIPLVVYGENVNYEYGGPLKEETYSAKDQIKNDVVKPIDWDFWFKKGVTKEEVKFIEYPLKVEIDKIEPIYLSYFLPWDGFKNYQLAKTRGFRDLTHEWKREGFIEDYDQIDSIAYLADVWFKYPKYGFARTTDVCCYWIRSGRITREYAIKLVKEHDHKLDQKALDDFLSFAGYTDREFWEIAEKLYNKEIFERIEGKWRLKDPIYKDLD